MPPTMTADPTTDPGVRADGLRRDTARLLAEIRAIREAQALGPETTPAGLTDVELGRRLTYDTLATLSRAELVLQIAADEIVPLLEILRQANGLKLDELDLRRREIVLKETANAKELERDRWRMAAVARVGGEVLGYVALILKDPRFVTFVITTVAAVTTTLLGVWATGSSIRLVDGTVTPPGGP